MPPPLVGDRIVLRQFRSEDAQDVFAYSCDPELSRYVEWEPHATPQDSAVYIRRCRRASPEFLTLAVEHRALRRVIGSLDLRTISRLRRLGEIGYTIARPFWGQGINLEAGCLLLDFAFSELHLRRVIAVCDVANRRSYRTMEKLGMVRERIIPHARYDHDIPIDRYQYSILRHEWEKMRPAPSPAGDGTPLRGRTFIAASGADSLPSGFGMPCGRGSPDTPGSAADRPSRPDP